MTSEPVGSLGQEVGNFYGDGAYDKRTCRKAVHSLGGQMVVPLPKNAVPSKGDRPELTSRDQAIAVSYTHLTLPTICSV